MPHTRLEALLAQLGVATEDRRARVLGKLREELDLHFRSEEAPGGFLAQALAAAPQHAAELDALREEHHELAATAARLAREPDTDEVATFVAALTDHERREAAVLANLAYEEVGAGD